MKLKTGAVLSAESEVGEGRGTYVLLERYNSQQWRVLVLEPDPGADEEAGEWRVINNEWLNTYAREIGE